MRQNLPVTDNERKYRADQKLISSTDLKGKIVHCNQAFVDVSGYSREELIGQPHNIIRHPDMPQEAYSSMWTYLKAGKPWMGMVKNRCKNGDYYWVSAYVTPVFANGDLVGYESVRTQPSRDLVARADKVYADIRSGRYQKVQALKKFGQFASWIVPAATGVMAGLSVAGTQGLVTGLLAGAVLTLGYQLNRYMRRVKQLRKVIEPYFHDELAATVYHLKGDCVGKASTTVTALVAQTETVLTRMLDASAKVVHSSEQGVSMSLEAHGHIARQGEESRQLAAAMAEISEATSAISSSILTTADNTRRVRDQVTQGTRISAETQKSIASLSYISEKVAETIQLISEHTQQISNAAKMIEGIAEQTNLLALNAAIEAARAGEQGRGFAVVADEVRSLAQRTQETTGHIHSAMSELTVKVQDAVSVSADGSTSVQEGLEQVTSLEKMFGEITSAVEDIAVMSESMAKSAERQSELTQQMECQTDTINALASSSMERSQDAADSIRDILTFSTELNDLVKRFR